MRRIHLALSLFATLFAVPVLGQEVESTLELRFFRPKNVDVASMYNLVRELHARELPGEGKRSSQNIIMGNGAILVHEDKARMQQIADTIAQLDVSHGPEPADFTTEVYHPTKSSVQALGQLAMQLFNRTIPVGNGGHRDSISMAADQIVVRETAERSRDILVKLAALDEAVGAQDPKNAPDAMEYTPRAISVQTALSALQPFTQARAGQRAPTIHVLNQQGVLILRGQQDQLVSIRSLLQRIDKPAPQVMLSAFVLMGSRDDNGDANEEISDALRELLPYRSYTVVGSSIIRVAARPMKQFTMDLNGLPQPAAFGNPPVFHLQGTIEAYDPDNPAMTFQSLTATKSGAGGRASQLFRTSTTIYGGEYAVLGVAGGKPEFVVLRLKPIGQRGHRPAGQPR